VQANKASEFDREIQLNLRHLIASEKSKMPLSELLDTVSQLSHQDKLRLIHFLLLAVAKEEGCSLEHNENSDLENALLNQLTSTEAVVWSPQADHEAVQALSALLVAAKEAADA
jgi:hypothetical protein